MAAAAEKKKQPLSLNERHDRLLQDLSASQSHRPHSSIPQPHPTPSTDEMDESIFKLQGRRRLCKASFKDNEYSDDVPRFSAISDFDSSPPDETKPAKLELEGGKRFGRDDWENKPMLNRPNFSEITDFDSHLLGKESTQGNTQALTSSRQNDNEEEKPIKVKIQGRRRLCRVSGKDDNDDDVKDKKTEDDESALADFESPPPPVKNIIECGYGGGDENDIRDILNDLSSRLEILSMERRRIPKTVDLSEDSSSVAFMHEVKNQRKKEELLEFSSAASSFSLSPEPSNSLSVATHESRVRNGVNTVVNENVFPSGSEGEFFVASVDRVENDGKQLKKSEAKRIGGKSVFGGRSNVVAQEVDADGADDECMVLSGKKCVEEVEKQSGRFGHVSDDSDEIDILDSFGDDSLSGNADSIKLNGPKSTFRLSGKISKMLYPHQRDGLKWLWSLHCQGKGGILGDDMGLGKTMQICGFLAGLFYSSLIKRALIVAPKTLLPHWIKELSTVGLSEKTREYFGTCSKSRQYELQYVLQDKGVLLTTYDIVRNNAKSLCGDYYLHGDSSEDEITWDYMILDEGHLIKNPSTQRAKSLLEIPCAHRIIISGTPIQNNLKELWALFNFCCPELLGDKNWFKEKYEYFILRGNEKNASDREKRIGSTVAKDLRERIQPYFLRRLKNEVFHEHNGTNNVKLSKKNEIIVWLRLTNCQRQLYEAFLNSELVLSAFDGSPLAALTILKKICDHPLLLTKRAAEDLLEGMDSSLSQEDRGIAAKLAMHIADVKERLDYVEKHDQISCKISFISALLGDLIPKGHNVLIFSQTCKMLNLIQESLISNGYNYLRIDGTTKASDRVKIVNDFQEGIGAPIFLLTSQVGGLGLTLTKADRVIVVDPAWNPSTDNQSVDRAYRIGQNKDVLVYRLMTCGTVEEKIYRKQIFKGGLFKTATEHKEQIRYFSQQDLRELFSLPNQGFDISVTQKQLHEEHDQQHTMDQSLKAHVNFLENLGIAGISHHSLLFSKTAPVPLVVEDDEVVRVKRTTIVGTSSSSSSFQYNVNGAEYAFNPKDVNLHAKNTSPNSVREPTETEIRERMNRLSQILANKVTISKLPDKGERIQKQIAELNSELDKIRMAKSSEKEIIDLDDLAGELQRVVNM